MEELQLLSQQKPGEVIIDNFQELREELSGVLNRYEHLVYTDGMLADAKADKKELTRLRRELDDRRKEVKRAYLASYNAFEGKVKELLAMIDAPLEEIKGFIVSMEEREKAVKRQEIEAYFRRKSGPLGDLAEQVLSSPAFLEDKWLNKSTSAKAWQTAVDEKIAAAARDLGSIQTTAGQHSGR